MAPSHRSDWINAGTIPNDTIMYSPSTESSPRKTESRLSQHDWQSQFQLPTPSSTLHSTYQVTPPSTPNHSETDYSASGLSLFHNYLRALHPYDPQSRASTDDGDDESALTAAIKPGDLILVHCVHANGWADGTVINTGARGWLPTNYCEVYDHIYIRNLLNATTTFWDLLGVTEEGNLSTFVRQDYIRGLIAGVRSLLERTACLHRDEDLVLRHVGIRRMRKGLLADLSSLVQIAKRLQEFISETSTYDGEVVPTLLDELITKAFKVVTRAVSFLDVWNQEASSAKAVAERAATPSGRATPLSRGRHLAPIDSSVKRVSATIHTPADSAKYIPTPDEVEQRQAVTAGPDRNEQKRASVARARNSMVFTPPAGQVAHRMSFIQRSSMQLHASSSPMASEELAKVHDVCISEIGAYIGNHFNSRHSSELVATTDRLVQACRKMLAIIREVTSRDPLASQPLHQARIDLETKVDELEHYAKEVFRFSDSAEEEVVMLPDQSNHLIRVGTSLIRNTGGCVVETKQIIERIGDFELSGKLWSIVSSSNDASPTSGQMEPTVDASAEAKMPAQEGINLKRHSLTKRLSTKMLPPPPPMPVEGLPASEQTLVPAAAAPLAATEEEAVSPAPTQPQVEPTSTNSMEKVPEESSLDAANAAVEVTKSPRSSRSFASEPPSPVRKASGGMSVSGSTDTCPSARYSSITAQSETSTRATTPDHLRDSQSAEAGPGESVDGLSSAPLETADDASDAESQFLQKTFAHELTWNKDGNVTGGSLPALVEQLTTHDSAPDSQFVSAFFLTFRRFTDPRDFAQALIDRFDYIGDSADVGRPARLRICNIFKMWIESHWVPEADKEALGEIRYFAMAKLKPVLASAAERLMDLTRRASSAYQSGESFGAGLGKPNISVARVPGENGIVPDHVISKSQLNILRVANGGGAPCAITDFDPLEIARQITLVLMTKLCAVHPQEFVAMDWNNPNTKKSRNVREMCLINTDLAHVVGDTILAPDEPKKRANILKHWIKVASACLDIGNYDSIFSIICTINSTPIRRLKRTWDLLHKKTRARFEELEEVAGVARNYVNMRRRLENCVAPCMPFLGIFLTDLTFILAGNPKRRELPGVLDDRGSAVSVINFDMYARIARIVANIQQFQVQFHYKPLPEMQSWLAGQCAAMRQRGFLDHCQIFHERSLVVEPRVLSPGQIALQQQQQQAQQQQLSQQQQQATSPSTDVSQQQPRRRGTTDDHRFDFFLKGTSALSHGLRSISSHTDLHTLSLTSDDGRPSAR